MGDGVEVDDVRARWDAVTSDLGFVNFADRAARRLFKVPVEWVPTYWSVKDDCVEVGFNTVLGKKRNGQTKFSKERRIYTITLEQFREEPGLFEVETGSCMDCRGVGHELAGVSLARGRWFRVCRRCGGTGKATVMGVDVKNEKEGVS